MALPKVDWSSLGAWIKDNKIAAAIIAGVIGLVLLGGFLFLSDRISTAWNMRKIDKIRANVNAAQQEISNIQANIQREKQAEAAALERVKIETNTFLDSVNATDAARQETNRALSNMQSAINANRPVGITAEELDRRLRELDY